MADFFFFSKIENEMIYFCVWSYRYMIRKWIVKGCLCLCEKKIECVRQWGCDLWQAVIIILADFGSDDPFWMGTKMKWISRSGDYKSMPKWSALQCVETIWFFPSSLNLKASSDACHFMDSPISLRFKLLIANEHLYSEIRMRTEKKDAISILWSIRNKQGAKINI